MCYLCFSYLMQSEEEATDNPFKDKMVNTNQFS